MNLERIKKDIDHQTRNGRDNIYIEKKDIIELIQGSAKEVRGKERIYINIDTINQLIKTYKENTKLPGREEFMKRIRVDMPDYKLTKIDEHGYLFQPIKEEREER